MQGLMDSLTSRKKKCRATCDQNQKDKKKANIRTLFNFGIKKASDIATSSTTAPLTSSINHHIPPIIVHPDEHSSSDDLLNPYKTRSTSQRQGCDFGWDLLEQ